ncbi:hypothetical protein JR316_0012736 [Psilocybe cubensis]|uniref:Uncharacterized protein n=2 Tax=Psilocybe cubensis TaxID=181762 RepID=A0ACB8GJE3_PSICU|nr:hypothetical protein JR316_0012736 [Psilocybe cubensis]KAH9475619.1 hypothetical protein JR316_0012736 [Psilocybe cubensis]
MSTNANFPKQRKLKFFYDGLDRDVELVLLLARPMDKYAFCWKVIKCQAGVKHSELVTYCDTLLTCTAWLQEDTGRVIPGSPVVPCQAGQKCTMKMDEEGNNYLTPTVDYEAPTSITCYFDTTDRADIIFGLLEGSDKTTMCPVTKFRDIKPGTTLMLEFTPMLSVYAVDGYHAQDIFKSASESQPLLCQNLNDLRRYTKWEVLTDKDSGCVKIVLQDD